MNVKKAESSGNSFTSAARKQPPFPQIVNEGYILKSGSSAILANADLNLSFSSLLDGYILCKKETEETEEKLSHANSQDSHYSELETKYRQLCFKKDSFYQTILQMLRTNPEFRGKMRILAGDRLLSEGDVDGTTDFSESILVERPGEDTLLLPDSSAVPIIADINNPSSSGYPIKRKAEELGGQAVDKPTKTKYPKNAKTTDDTAHLQPFGSKSPASEDSKFPITAGGSAPFKEIKLENSNTTVNIGKIVYESKKNEVTSDIKAQYSTKHISSIMMSLREKNSSIQIISAWIKSVFSTILTCSPQDKAAVIKNLIVNVNKKFYGEKLDFRYLITQEFIGFFGEDKELIKELKNDKLLMLRLVSWLAYDVKCMHNQNIRLFLGFLKVLRLSLEEQKSFKLYDLLVSLRKSDRQWDSLLESILGSESVSDSPLLSPHLQSPPLPVPPDLTPQISTNVIPGTKSSEIEKSLNTQKNIPKPSANGVFGNKSKMSLNNYMVRKQDKVDKAIHGTSIQRTQPLNTISGSSEIDKFSNTLPDKKGTKGILVTGLGRNTGGNKKVRFDFVNLETIHEIPSVKHSRTANGAQRAREMENSEAKILKGTNGQSSGIQETEGLLLWKEPTLIDFSKIIEFEREEAAQVRGGLIKLVRLDNVHSKTLQPKPINRGTEVSPFEPVEGLMTTVQYFNRNDYKEDMEIDSLISDEFNSDHTVDNSNENEKGKKQIRQEVEEEKEEVTDTHTPRPKDGTNKNRDDSILALLDGAGDDLDHVHYSDSDTELLDEEKT